MDIRSKVVIITGASSGIGLATAKLMASHGARVALIARSKDKLRDLSLELAGSFSRPTDMTDQADIKHMVQAVHRHYGRIDVLINNAGQGYDASVQNINIDTFQRLSNLDLIGPLVAMQQVIPIMKAQGGGSIINISSGTALMHLPTMGAYAAMKAALAHLSLTARVELKPLNITVSVVYPYITLTDFETNTLSEPGNHTGFEYTRSYEPPVADSAEYIAQKIVECIKSGEGEVYAHDWMNQAHGSGAKTLQTPD
jgi:short-subunit dehydrogenase